MNHRFAAGLTLTRKPKRFTLHRMSKARATAFGLTTDQLAAIAKQAGRDAVAENIEAGVSTTVLIDGRVQKLDASDPRLLELVNVRSSNVRAS
ncbi:hypothetical protein LJR129_005089 [Acidovorax sp. LjRoot129]|uniref:hypothetical protein n=1 Tax=unclassified Acidovorax TaxID=2684926 RepID=UPI003ED0240C